MASTETSEQVVKPDFGSSKRHLIFTQEHEDLRESMEAWVKKELAPNAEEWEETLWPDSVLKRMADLGFVGLCFPEEYGGQGGDYYYSLVRAEALSHSGSGGLNMGLAVHTDMVLPPIEMLGNEDQKQRYLVPGIKGEKIASLGITEPGAGSDVAGIRTTARKDGDEYVINGSKIFITNGARADFILLVTKTDPDARHDGITLFIVDLKDEDGNPTEGFSVSRKLEKLGMHSSDTAELSFEDVRVPAENLIGQEGKGFYHISWELQGERLVGAIGCVAGAERIFEQTLEYAKEREAFGRPIAKFQNTSFKLAECATEVEVGRHFLDAVTRRHAAGEYLVKECSMAKLWQSEMLGRVVDECLQFFGGYGYMLEYPISRAYMDARVQRIYAGTNEIMKVIIAKQLDL